MGNERHFRILSFVLLVAVRAITVTTLLLAIAGAFVDLVFDFRTRIGELKAGGAVTTGSYFLNTDIPTATGGSTGFGFSQTVKILVLFTGVLSELPLPARINLRVQQCWDLAFPPFSEERGVGVLGLIMAIFGSYELGRNTRGYPRGAAWALFVVGLINILLGVTLRSSIAFYRSLESVSGNEEDEKEYSYRHDYPTLPQPITAPSVVEHSRVRFKLPSVLSRPFSSAPTQRSVSVYSQDGVPLGPDTSRVSQQVPVHFGWEERNKLGPMTQIRRL